MLILAHTGGCYLTQQPQQRINNVMGASTTPAINVVTTVSTAYGKTGAWTYQLI